MNVSSHIMPIHHNTVNAQLLFSLTDHIDRSKRFYEFPSVTCARTRGGNMRAEMIGLRFSSIYGDCKQVVNQADKREYEYDCVIRYGEKVYAMVEDENNENYAIFYIINEGSTNPLYGVSAHNNRVDRGDAVKVSPCHRNGNDPLFRHMQRTMFFRVKSTPNRLHVTLTRGNKHTKPLKY